MEQYYPLLNIFEHLLYLIGMGIWGCTFLSKGASFHGNLQVYGKV